MITVYRWADGTWCEKCDLEGYLQWMSDDFEELKMDEYEFDEFLRNN